MPRRLLLSCLTLLLAICLVLSALSLAGVLFLAR
jgi:hypothetical protein